MDHGSRPARPDRQAPDPTLSRGVLQQRGDTTGAWCAHEMMQCLTAIRNYAAGARRAADKDERENMAYALLSIDRQIDRAHELLATARREWGKPGGTQIAAPEPGAAAAE